MELNEKIAKTLEEKFANIIGSSVSNEEFIERCQKIANDIVTQIQLPKINEPLLQEIIEKILPKSFIGYSSEEGFMCQVHYPKLLKIIASYIKEQYWLNFRTEDKTIDEKDMEYINLFSELYVNFMAYDFFVKVGKEEESKKIWDKIKIIITNLRN